MSDEIKPTPDGSCSYDECPSYDGKRCRLTGFRPHGCEPAFAALVARLAAAQREFDAERAAGAALAGRLGEVQAKADCAERENVRWATYGGQIEREREALAAAERERDEARADRDKAEENERVLADLLLSESVPTEDVHREIKARVDSGKIPPFIVCGWCGAPAGTMEAYKAHAVTCSENPAVQRAVAAEDSLSDLYATGDRLIGSWSEPCRVEFRAAMERVRPLYDAIVIRAMASGGKP